MPLRPSDIKLVRYGPRVVTPLIITALPLMLGGTSPSVIVGASLTLLLTMTAVIYRKGVPTIRNSWTLIGCVIAVLATVAQLIPVPLPLLRLGAPSAHELLSLGTPPTVYPFSMDPPASALALVRYLGMTAAAVLGYRVYARRPRELFSAIAAAGALIVLTGALHVVIGWRQPYGHFGIYPEVFPTPFINPNHMGGFCAFCGFIAVALATELDAERRWIAFGLAALCTAGVVLSFSRGAVLAFSIGTLVYGISVVRRGGRVRQLAPIAVLLALGGILFAAIAERSIADQLRSFAASSDEVRPLLWMSSILALPGFWLLGMGSGAYGYVITASQPPRQYTFTFAENEPLQFLMDWGLIFGTLALCAVVAFVWRLVRMRSSDGFIPALFGAFAAVGANALVDFGMSTLAIGVPVLACAAMLEGRGARVRRNGQSERRSEETSQVAARPLSRRFGLGLGFASIVVASLVSTYALAHENRCDVERLRAATLAETPRDRDAALSSFVRHHPADFLGPLIAAEREIERPRNEQRALHLVNRALIMAPSFAVVHRIAGRALLKVGATQQALSEYRTSLDLWPLDIPLVVLELEHRAPGHLIQVAGENDERRLWIARDCFFAGRHCSVATIEGLLRVPTLENNPEALQLLTRLALRERDWTTAIERARSLEALHPGLAFPYEAQADAHRALGERDRARAALERGRDMTGGATTILNAMTNDAIERGDLDEAQEIANRLVARASTTGSAADAHAMLATIWERRRRYSESIRELERARDAAPKEPSFYLRLAEIYRKTGNSAAAGGELRRGIAATGGDLRLKQALASQESRP